MSGVTISKSGPLFDNADKIIEGFFQNVIQATVEKGEEILDKRLRPRPAGVYLSFTQAGRGKASTGHYRRSVHSEIQDSRAVIDDSRVIYGNWLEGTGSRNSSTRFKGYASFRKTTDDLNRTEVKKILKRLGAKVARDLNG